MSVKRIISPLIFDNLKAPLPQGLYDPAMGPLVWIVLKETQAQLEGC